MTRATMLVCLVLSARVARAEDVPAPAPNFTGFVECEVDIKGDVHIPPGERECQLANSLLGLHDNVLVLQTLCVPPKTGAKP